MSPFTEAMPDAAAPRASSWRRSANRRGVAGLQLVLMGVLVSASYVAPIRAQSAKAVAPAPAARASGTSRRPDAPGGSARSSGRSRRTRRWPAIRT